MKRSEIDVRRSGAKPRLSGSCRFLAIGVALCLCGCVPAPRAAMSEAQQSAAYVDGVSLARFWGDEVTPDIQAAFARQYGQVKVAAAAGIRRSSAERADFLAISGGGGDGAYAAGFLTGWSRRGERPAFEVVTGISTGALAAPFAFLGPRYDVVLEQIYTAYGDQDIMRSRGLLGVFGNALYDDAPLRKLIADHMSEAVLEAIADEYRLGRRLLIQTTNIDAQRPVIWDLSAICASGRKDRRDLVVDILLASAAIPAVFPPVRLKVRSNGRIYEELHVDGGVSAQLFFAPPDIGIGNFERKIFGHVRHRRLYVIRNGRLSPSFKTVPERTLPIARRAIETLTKYQGISDLSRLEALASRGRAELVYTSIPASFRAEAKSEFDKAYMRRLFRVGYEAGLAGNWQESTPVTPVLAGRLAVAHP